MCPVSRMGARSWQAVPGSRQATVIATWDAVERAAAQQEQEDLRKALKQLEALYVVASFGVISHGIDSKLDQNHKDQVLRAIPHVGDAVYNSYENQRHQKC